MAIDWIEWHRAYDDPDSSLSRRLTEVVRMIRAFLDDAPPGEIKMLSLCAGDGRDITSAATRHPRAGDLRGVLVEFDSQLAQSAVGNIASIGATLEVRCADASDASQFAHSLPVDLLLLCGIFGNIDEHDIQATIAKVPEMCRPGATVIWTRHRKEPDLTPRIREWFDAAGCQLGEFASPGVGSFAVGREICAEPRPWADVRAPMFVFRDELR
jgi:hypothetical protein